MKYLLILTILFTFSSCEKYGCECGDVIADCNDSDADGLYNFTAKNHCSGNIREFEFPTCGDQFIIDEGSSLIDYNQSGNKIYCHNTEW